MGFQPGTAEYEVFAFLLPLMGSSEDLKDYMEHDCKSSTITGELVALYANIQALDDPDSLAAVTTCRDVNNYSESLIE